MPLYLYSCNACKSQQTAYHGIGEDGPISCEICNEIGSLYRDFNQSFNVVKKTEVGAAKERINDFISEVKSDLIKEKERLK